MTEPSWSREWMEAQQKFIPHVTPGLGSNAYAAHTHVIHLAALLGHTGPVGQHI